MANEEWRDVTGFEGLYQVSSLGRVKSVRLKERNGHGILKPLITPNGYEQVSFSTNGIRKQVTVHVLVAEAFHGGRPEGLVVNHLNGIKTDNRASNLEYCTQKENDRHSRFKLGNHFAGERNAAAKLTEQQVREIRETYATGTTSQPKLAYRYGVSQAAIWRVVNNRNWTPTCGDN